jgi:hypothetical protein
MIQYAIMVRLVGADVGSEIELCRVTSSPEAIVEAALKKTRVVNEYGKRKIIEIYEHAYFKEITSCGEDTDA